MSCCTINHCLSLKGEVRFSGDKSISHRAIILSAISNDKVVIKNISLSEDCLRTINAFKKMGVQISLLKKGSIVVRGRSLRGLKRPKADIFTGDSGTTMRILTGVLAGQDFSATLTAGESLKLRPMRRVIEPLRIMGAKISAKRKAQNAKLEEYPPLTIKGGDLRAITYKMPVASAQVKSAILLAGLYAKGTTKVIEPLKTRDHTERMLRLFGAKVEVKVKAKAISIKKSDLKGPGEIFIPGDISSASFFIVGAAITPGSRLLIKSVSLNPTRTGIIKVLKRMNADITVHGTRLTVHEPFGDVIVKSSNLKGAVIKKEEVPSLIDELPVLMVAACFAQGKSVFESVEELRVKESDRIRAMCANLRKMGADIRVVKGRTGEKIIIRGVPALKGCRVDSFGDHRVAMSMAIAGLVADGKTVILGADCVKKSFPDFFQILHRLIR